MDTNANLQNPQTEENVELSIEQKLTNLYRLQQIESQIDRIRIIRGELPLEVQDLEDEIAGLETRIDNYIQQIAEYVKNSGKEKYYKRLPSSYQEI